MVHQEFLELYDSCFDDVYRYVYFKVGNKWDTDDIVSEIFKKAYEKHKTIISNPRCWLFSIARNTVIDFYRRKKEIAVSYEEMEDSTYLCTLDNCHEEELEMIDIRQALHSLPEEELEIINLRCFADMTYKNIGRCLNKSEAAVKVKFSRIMKKLREMLNQ